MIAANSNLITPLLKVSVNGLSQILQKKLSVSTLMSIKQLKIPAYSMAWILTPPKLFDFGGVGVGIVGIY